MIFYQTHSQNQAFYLMSILLDTQPSVDETTMKFKIGLSEVLPASCCTVSIEPVSEDGSREHTFRNLDVTANELSACFFTTKTGMKL